MSESIGHRAGTITILGKSETDSVEYTKFIKANLQRVGQTNQGCKKSNQMFPGVQDMDT